MSLYGTKEGRTRDPLDDTWVKLLLGFIKISKLILYFKGGGY
jgi:hypothetical protein